MPKSKEKTKHIAEAPAAEAPTRVKKQKKSKKGIKEKNAETPAAEAPARVKRRKKSKKETKEKKKKTMSKINCEKSIFINAVYSVCF